MADVTVLPTKAYPNGEQTFGPAPIGDSISRIEIKIARCTTATPNIWPDQTMTIRLTFDTQVNGVWEQRLDLQGEGGIVSIFGNESEWTAGGFDIPAGTGRNVRGTLTIVGGPIRTSAVITVI